MRPTFPIAATVLSIAALPAFAQAPPASESGIAALVERFAEQSVRQRQDIHRHAELSNREHRTAAIVAKHLRDLGMEVETGIARTGVVGILRGGRPGQTIAVRADMDGLPVTEESTLPFRSTARGVYLDREVDVSHACGHDVHVAAQLGVASALAAMRESLPGTVMFIFQPAEEGPPPGERGGAGLMVEEGIFEKVKPDAVIAFHTNGDPPDEEGDDEFLGKVSYTPGPMYAAATRWSATVHGRQAHGASPHLGVDPIVTASQIVMALQTLRSRVLPPNSDNVVTVGIFRAGERHNIIPATVELAGTIRTFDDGVLDTIETRMREIFEGTTKAAHATYELSFDRSHPMTVNDPKLTAKFAATLERLVGPGNIREVPPQTGAEDFSYFARLVPGFYFNLGVVPEGKKSGGHHTPTFYADDGAVPIAMRLMTALVLDYLGGEAPP